MAPEMKPIKVVAPWNMVGMDLVGPLTTSSKGNKYVLTITDYFTKFVDFCAIPAKSGQAVAKGLKTFFMRLVGIFDVFCFTFIRKETNKINFYFIFHMAFIWLF